MLKSRGVVEIAATLDGSF